MKTLFFFLTITFSVLTLKSQTLPPAEKYVLLEGQNMLEQDYLYQDSNYVYFQKDNSYFKISQDKVLNTVGIDFIPTTTYYQDMYSFTKKGKNALTLYLLGSLTMSVGTIVTLTSGVEDIRLPIAFLVVGSGLTLIGLITEFSAWSTGKKANIKLMAKEY